MQENSIPCFVISTIINGRKNYIHKHVARESGRSYVPEYKHDLQEAKAFTDEEDAATLVGKLFNPYHREFKIEPAELPKTVSALVVDEDLN